MSQTKHTPGPWVIEKLSGGWGVHAPNWGYVAFHVSSDLPHWNEGQEANRRLIAAAPELLAALVKAERMFREIGFIAAADSARPESLWNEITTAIAKATGEGA